MRTINNKLNKINNKKFINSIKSSIIKILEKYKFLEETNARFSPEAIELAAKFSLIISKRLLQTVDTYITPEIIYKNAEKYLKGELKYHSLHQSRKVFLSNKPIKNKISKSTTQSTNQPTNQPTNQSTTQINFKVFRYLLPKNKSISNIGSTSLAYIIEYIITELLELSTIQANNIIFPEDIVSIITKDHELKSCITNM